jgi:hypothetical protein
LDSSFSSILYKDSPFLPRISQESVNRVIFNMVSGIPPVTAIAEEVGFIGTTQNLIHEDEFDWLEKTFKLDIQNLDNFMFGFITPPVLIIGASYAEKYGYPAAIKVVCPPSDDEILISHNRFKAYHLPRASHLIQNRLYRHPLVSAEPIYELCKVEVYADDLYYSAGVEASKIHFASLSTIYDLLLKSTPP